ncbi:MAG TPA: GntP family permease [Prolixibacteraceae bacterium]
MIIITAILIGLVLIVVFTSILKYNAFLSIFVVTLLIALFTLPLQDVVPTILLGFGNTMKSIGLIIIFGIILGLILDKTHATKSIAHAILKLTGKKNAGMAIHSTGFITGIPIFCDSGFIVLQGINKSLIESTGKPMVFMASVLAAGLYSVHCLIPPHPGATAAAGIMSANIGQLILVGLPVAAVSSLAGFLWVRFITRKDYSIAKAESTGKRITEVAVDLPSPFRSFLPIVVPVILLSGRSVLLLFAPNDKSYLLKVVSFLGEPIIALMIGILLAITLYKKVNSKELNELFDLSIEKAGAILAIVAAGGIFGTVIKSTGIGEVAGAYLASTGLGLFVPFLIAAFLKTAQGSSTVAVMTSASVISPMLISLNLSSENGIVLATLAMGAGSMFISHSNDAFFWVITKFSDLEIKSTLRVWTTTTAVMGIFAFGSVWVLSLFLR